jgi:hypothetical protein
MLIVDGLSAMAAGSVMATDWIAVQLLASLTVTVYVPAESEFILALELPLLHE